MMLYLDTSSLVKLYVNEAYSETVRTWVDEAETVATCRTAFPEALSAMTRRLHAGDIGKKDYEQLVKTFEQDWPHCVSLDFDEHEAGLLVKKHGIRGFDAIHLASAKMLFLAQKGVELFFSSFDDKLNKAANAERFQVLKP